MGLSGQLGVFMILGNKDEAAKSLEEALKLEVEGYTFYIGCSEKSKSKEAKDMFVFLANEEKKHYDDLAKIY